MVSLCCHPVFRFPDFVKLVRKFFFTVLHDSYDVQSTQELFWILVKIQGDLTLLLKLVAN